MILNSVKQDGLWVPPSGLEVPFTEPNPADMQSELSDSQRYSLCVAVNEVVRLAYNYSIFSDIPEVIHSKMLADPTAVATYHTDKKLELASSGAERDTAMTKIPASATIGDFKLTGAEAQEELEGYSGVRVDYADSEGRMHVARIATKWAMLDDQPLDTEAYNALFGKIVTETMQDDEDLSFEIFDNALKFSLVGSETTRSNMGIVLDDSSATQVYAETFIDRRNPRDKPDRYLQLSFYGFVGLENPRDLYENFGALEGSVAEIEGTVTEIMFVLPTSMVALRRPLNGKKSDFRFVDKDDNDLIKICRLMDDLRMTQRICQITGQNSRPLVIDRRGSGIAIDYQLTEHLQTRAQLPSRMPWKVMSPDEAARLTSKYPIK